MVAEQKSFEIFFSYDFASAPDKKLLQELEEQLKHLEQGGQFTIWHRGKIRPGANTASEIEKHLNIASIIVLLISSKFLSSEDYTMAEEAIKTRRDGVSVIPVILSKPVGWEELHLSHLTSLPKSGLTVVTKKKISEEALEEVAEELWEMIKAKAASQTVEEPAEKQHSVPPPSSTFDQYSIRPILNMPVKRVTLSASATSDQHSGSSTPSAPDDPGTMLSVKTLETERISRRKILIRISVVVGAVVITATGIGTAVHFAEISSTPTPATGHKPKPDSTAAPRPDPIATPALKAFYISRHHTAEVDTVAWSPRANLIASGSRDKTVDVWNLLTGKVLTYTGHHDWVYCVAWSPDGSAIASASYDRTIQVWDPETGTPSGLYSGHTAVVLGVAWSPDGKSIASASDDKTVQVWNASTDEHIYTYARHSAGVDAVTWSPDGTRIASASKDKTVHVWDASTGQHPLIYPGHTQEVDSVAWSPDGKNIASASYDKTVHIWDATTGKRLLMYTGHTDIVRHVAWSPDGTRIASAGSDGTVQIWDAATGRTNFTYRAHISWVDCAVWSPDGSHIASSGADKTVQVWRPS